MCDCDKMKAKPLAEQLYEALRPGQAFRAGTKMAFPQDTGSTFNVRIDSRTGKPAPTDAPAAKTQERIAMETELRVEALRAAVTSDYDDKAADEIVQDARIFYAFLITSLI